MTSPGANSGIYVHTKWQGPGWPEAGYELQVINSNPPAEKMNGYIEHKMTGSVYAVRNTWQAPRRQRVVQLPHPGGRQDHSDFHQRQFDLRIRRRSRTRSGPKTRRAACWAPARSRCRRTIRQHRELPQYEGPRSCPTTPRRPRASCRIADRELDQLITQASDDNIPLIDLGLSAPDGGSSEEFDRQARRYGVLPMRIQDLPQMAGSVAVLVDRDRGPDVELLKASRPRDIAWRSVPAAPPVSTRRS